MSHDTKDIPFMSSIHSKVILDSQEKAQFNLDTWKYSAFSSRANQESKWRRKVDRSRIFVFEADNFGLNPYFALRKEKEGRLVRVNRHRWIQTKSDIEKNGLLFPSRPALVEPNPSNPLIREHVQ
mmetsp:Transcript_7201/g.12650  ORF Transcript_7201/g.12650 Transcript_7201/m.12650 type:complete len:125 (-) Transcript_7201:3-377(-)